MKRAYYRARHRTAMLDPVPEEQGRMAKGKEEGEELELAEVLLRSDGPL